MDISDENEVQKERVVIDAGLSAAAGYYGNYSEMKEHASRHPKAVVRGGIGGQHIIQRENEDKKKKSTGESDTQETIRHLTERDVHTYFRKKEVFSNLEATKIAAKNVRKDYFTNWTWWKRIIFQTFPIIGVIHNYDRSYIFWDVVAGLSAGIAAIPIGMSYAKLGNFEPQYGLYCQLFYALVYTFFGTGRQVCVGASAVEGMITAQAITSILGNTYTTAEWNNVSYGLSFFVGSFLITMRCLNLGMISSFLADSVVSGFSTACALTIAVSQLQYFVGIPVPRNLQTYQIVLFLSKNIYTINWYCLAIAFSGIILLFLLQILNSKWTKHYPIPSSLVFVIVFIFLGYQTKMDRQPYNVPVVGTIPMGLPKPQAFSFESTLLLPVAKQALSYALVYFLMHVSVVNRFAQKHGYLIDYNQELLATGMCSMVGSFFQCYPIATSVARSSITDTSGGKTQLYNILNVFVILIVITKLTPLLYYLPWPSLASIVVYGVSKMFHFSEAVRLSQLRSFDFILWIVSFVSTLILGAMQGIILSVALSLIWIVKQNAFPATAVLGRLPGTKVFRDIRLFTDTQEVSGCKILRFDASINFSNTLYFEKLVHQLFKIDEVITPYSKKLTKGHTLKACDSLLASNSPSISSEIVNNNSKLSYHPKESTVSSICEREHSSVSHPKIRVLIIDASSVNHVDVTAIRMLRGLAKRLEEHDMIMLFANWKGPMRGYLEKAHFYDTIPPDHCFLSIHDAVLWAEVFYLHRNPSYVQDAR